MVHLQPLKYVLACFSEFTRADFDLIMTDHKCLPVLLVVNICIVLCASLPLSYKQTAETENVFNKVGPVERTDSH